jgi:hypothetical protein
VLKSCVLLASASLSLCLVAPTATAAPEVGERAAQCTSKQAGNKKVKFAKPVVRKWAHVGSPASEENYSGSTKTYTLTTGTSKTVKNTAKVSGEWSAKVSASVFAEVEAKVGLEIGKEKEKTTFSEKTEEFALKSGDKYFWGIGMAKVTTRVTVLNCQRVSRDDPNFYWEPWGTADIRAFAPTSAIVACKAKTPKGTYSRFIQNTQLCP